MSSCPNLICPEVGSSKPATILKVVVLPHPDGPNKAKNEPAGMVKVKLSTALKSPNDFVRFTKCKSSTFGRLLATLLVADQLRPSIAIFRCLFWSEGHCRVGTFQ